MTQKQIADKFGLAESTISMYEAGNREPNLEQLNEFADFFNVDLNYLLGKSNVTTSIKDGIYGDHKDNLEYFSDKPELMEIYKEIYESESLQLLFDSAKDLTPQDLETVLIIIKGIKSERSKN